jgi:branched-chain amino acid transport system substrate-binding protein
VGGLYTEGGLIIRQMRDQGMKTVMISGDGITDNEFAQIGGPGVEGTLMSFGPDPRNNPAAKDVVAAFKPKASIRRDIRSTPTPQSRS